MLCCITANAQVAKIGETNYDTFQAAIDAAKYMTGDVTVELYEKVTLNSSISGDFSSIGFVGKDTDAEIYLEVQGYITAPGKKVSFTDLTLSKSQGGFMTNAGFMNVAFGLYDVVEVAYTKCFFANGAYASSGKVTYTECTFKRSWDKYGLWAYGNVNITVDGCTFDDYRGIKMYAEGKAKTTDLTVRNTDFSALGGNSSKPAIVLTYGKSVTLEGNTYSDTGTFELDKDGDPNGTPVTSDVPPTCVNDNGACGVLVDGKIYTTVAQAAEVAKEGSIVTLLHDSQETVELPEGAMLDRNGYTAEGVSCSQAIYGDNIAEYTIVDGTDFDFLCKKEFTTVGTLTYTRTLASDKFNALFVPFNIPLTDELLADYEFFIFQQGYYESEENCYIEVASASEDVLEANTPYLIRPKSEEAKQMELVIENATLYASTTEIAPQSILADGYDFTITGTYSELSGADNAELAESYGISVNGYFAKIGNGTEENTGTLGAFRYYVQIKENNEGGESLKTARSLSIRISGESNDATGIVETENGNVKTENCYDLSGRRVQNVQKGIFIVNGKKVVK